MGFFVLGVNHKQCPVAVREKLHFTESHTAAALEALIQFEEIDEAVILSTCNRVEILGYTAGNPEQAYECLAGFIEKSRGVPRAEFSDFLYRYAGKDAIHHLFRVASGLDSLVIGENEILGQIREAFRIANQAKSVHSYLYRLIEKALKTGKEARTRTKINEGAVSIPSVAVELAEKIFGQLNGEKVMVLGTGEMSSLTIRNLRNSGAEVLFVVSRNRERGEAAALEFGAQWVALEDWEKHMTEIDILIASTAAPHLLIHKEQVQGIMTKRRGKPLFLIDISVPRNIDPSIDAIDDVYLYNVDDLKGVSTSNLKFRRREIEAAEKIVAEAGLNFQSWMEQMAARPTVERYEQFLDEVLERELHSLIRQSRISETEKEELKQRLRAKLLHPPLEKIKEASKNGGVARYVSALHALFDLDNKKS